MTLDPIPHIRREPLGMVLLPLVSLILIGWPFGFASAPYDPVWANRYPHRAAWMALAGPASNLALVLICIGLAWAGIFAGWFSIPDYVEYTHFVQPNAARYASGFSFLLSVIFTLNLLMTALNLIPLPPLDGSAVIGLCLSEERAAQLQDFARTPLFGMIGLVFVWKLFGPLFHAIFLLAVSLMYPGYYG